MQATARRPQFSRDRAPEPYGRVRLVVIPVVVALALVGLALVLQTPLNDREQRVVNWPSVTDAFKVHLEIVFASLAISISIGIPFGILLSRGSRWLGTIVFGVANLSQAIPGVSILAVAVFIPGLGIGTRSAIYALGLFSVLPILRNTVVGLTGIEPALIEAAGGMGMSAWQSLVRVQLPLAAPVIFAGLRTALVLNVGTATLATFIGGGGLGDIVNSGIENNLTRVTIVGATLVACLALVLDWLAGLIERRLTPAT